MNIAVIFAGGSGQRMHTRDVPKQFLICNYSNSLLYSGRNVYKFIKYERGA